MIKSAFLSLMFIFSIEVAKTASIQKLTAIIALLISGEIANPFDK